LTTNVQMVNLAKKTQNRLIQLAQVSRINRLKKRKVRDNYVADIQANPDTQIWQENDLSGKMVADYQLPCRKSQKKQKKHNKMGTKGHEVTDSQSVPLTAAGVPATATQLSRFNWSN